MKKINQVLKLFIAILTFSVPNIFADVKIISPVNDSSKVWGNKQILVVNTTDEEEVYYSFAGKDPLDSGFVYDEPVLIDLTGSIELKIATINKKQQRKDFVINYNVDETLSEKLSNLEEKAFIEKLNENAIFPLRCGDELDIPETFEYAVSSVSENSQMEFGKKIKVNENSTLDRYVSLTLKSKNNFWNYVIHAVPTISGEFSQASVPFRITDWSKVTFLDNKYIYALDDGWWQRSGQEVEVDRSVSHVIKWQSVEYDKFNPIQTYTIPASPKICAESQSDFSVEFSFDGDSSYRFSKSNNLSNIRLAPGLHDKILVDAFPGENLRTLLSFDVYSENVYQGKIFTSVQVNRQRPKEPKIVLSDNSEVCRQNVSYSIISDDKDYTVYYFVAGPQILSLEQLTENSSSTFIDNKINEKSFSVYNGKQLVLPSKDKPVIYKIYAYVVDSWNNISTLVEKDVLIDKSNYFVNFNSNVENPDGTFKKPFKDFSNLDKIVNSHELSNFYIVGNAKLDGETHNIRRSFNLYGINDAQICVDDKSSFLINGGSMTVTNLLVKSENGENDINNNFIVVSDGILNLKNVELSFERNKNAILINAVNSKINVDSCGLSVIANDYACIISSNKSDIKINNSRLSTVGTTNINLSSKKSKVVLSENNFSVDGINGRVAELFSSTGTIELNVLKFNKIFNSSKNDLLWMDRNSTISESKNKIEGF